MSEASTSTQEVKGVCEKSRAGKISAYYGHLPYEVVL